MSCNAMTPSRSIQALSASPWSVTTGEIAVMFVRAMNRSTSAGSNAVPANSRSTVTAAASLRAGRYGRVACSVL
jgi:hypothetical protein